MPQIKVLIIDDEMEFASTLAERLVLRNFDSTAVESGYEAMDILENGWIPDVVILDLKMPGLDGLAILDIIRGHHPEIKVIMLTGHGSTSSGITGMKKGLFDYMMKPVDIGELVARIKEAVDRPLISQPMKR
jgi:DNA-binding response OmpR family regulator